MDQLVGYVAVAAGIWVSPNSITDWIPFENEITIYMLSCSGEQVSGVCRGNETTDVPFTYKVLVDQHSVWYWTDTFSKPRRLPFCAVQDTKSWLCQWESNEIPKSRFGMMAGKYVEIPTCITDTTTSAFYQVPIWRWWLAWLHERFS
jgi:hypothetical protein